tara:strand:- start:1418 stop:1621 length:204 start_codon:yes stop_codon:yes gene_type:complete
MALYTVERRMGIRMTTNTLTARTKKNGMKVIIEKDAEKKKKKEMEREGGKEEEEKEEEETEQVLAMS